jgi:hypothetical protein
LSNGSRIEVGTAVVPERLNYGAARMRNSGKRQPSDLNHQQKKQKKMRSIK